MLVRALDGRHLEVRRRWMPWRLRKRRFENDGNPLRFVDAAEGPGTLLAAVLLGLTFFLFGGIILTLAVLASEALLLVLLLIPLFALARMFTVLPWIIEAMYAETVLGTAAVRGWRDSEEKIRALAAAYERGEDPFAGVG